MKRLCLLFPLIYAIMVSASYAELRICGNTSIIFATVNEGKEILTRRDDFVQRMSPFDRSARLKTKEDISESEYLGFVGRNILEWNSAETQRVTSAFQGIHAEIEALCLPFPEKVYIVKTTGNEEGGAAYTRANAIVLTEDDLIEPIVKIQKTLCHELFHVMSRINPDLRDKFYAAIGFVKCNEIAFPSILNSQKITNPDAPMNDHYISLQVKGNEVLVIPILFSSTQKYNIDRGGEFFNYLQLQFLLVERHDNSSTVIPIYDGRRPKFLDMRKQSGFFEQVGRNTRYIIHPEEILADNFAFLVLNQRDLPSPEIATKIERIIKKKKITEPSTSADAEKPRR